MNQLTSNDLKKIIARRDRRFDGRFYFGVKTTKIYCRPVCPARPKPENIIIFKSLAEAEKNGFRACLRCRPDVAPGSKLLDGTLNTVSRALRIINNSFDDDDLQIPTLAASLGVSERHVRRLFAEHLGASPIEIITAQRLHFAKQMIQTATIPIYEVAFAAGFQSLRRFNEAFKARYRTTPSALRKIKKTTTDSSFSLKLAIRLPYDWQSVIAYLKKYEIFGVECIQDEKYCRFIPHEDGSFKSKGYGTITVSHPKQAEFLLVQCTDISVGKVRAILTRLKHLFDTDHNPAHLPTFKGLTPNGIRVPGCFDPFETAISIILNQSDSQKQSTSQIKALVQHFGQQLDDNESGPVFMFPSASTLAAASLQEGGITQTKAHAIREFSRAVCNGSINFYSYSEFSAIASPLKQIKGITPWAIAMIRMRCLGDPDAFPESDSIVQKTIERKLVKQSQWTSSRAYLAHIIWRNFGNHLNIR